MTAPELARILEGIDLKKKPEITLIGTWLGERNRVVARDWFYTCVLDMKDKLEAEGSNSF